MRKNTADSCLAPSHFLWRADVDASVCGVTYSSNGGLFTISCRRMGHICTKKDHRLLEDQRPGVKQRGRADIYQIWMGVTDVQTTCLWRLMASTLTNLPCGRRMLLTPPSLTLIFRQRLERVWGVVFWTFFTCTHCVAMPSTVSPTRLTSAATHREEEYQLAKNKPTRHTLELSGRADGREVSSDWNTLTVDGRLPRQDDHHQLEALVGVLEVPEHGLHAVCSLGVLAEAGLALDGHPCVSGDLPQLICKRSETDEEQRYDFFFPPLNQSICFSFSVYQLNLTLCISLRY